MKITRKIDIPGASNSSELGKLFVYVFNKLGLHILYQQTDGQKFKRNEYANELEVFCQRYFYGPLVIALNDANAPFKLYDFPPHYLKEKIAPLNKDLQRYYPLPLKAVRCNFLKQISSEKRFQ